MQWLRSAALSRTSATLSPAGEINALAAWLRGRVIAGAGNFNNLARTAS
jgi:hypothetical protein